MARPPHWLRLCCLVASNKQQIHWTRIRRNSLETPKEILLEIDFIEEMTTT